MNLNDEIEILREQLNDMIINEKNFSDDKILELSNKLDKLIEKYYLYEGKIN